VGVTAADGTKGSENLLAATLRVGKATLAKRPGLVVEMHPSLWAASNTFREEMATLLADLNLHPATLTGQADAFGDYGLVSLEPAGAARFRSAERA